MIDVTLPLGQPLPNCGAAAGRRLRLVARLAPLAVAAQSIISFPAPNAAPRLSNARQALAAQFRLGPDEELRPLSSASDALGFVYAKFRQYYRGVRVEHGVCAGHARHGRIESLSGQLVPVPAGLAAAPALSAAAALPLALRAVGAQTYMWQLPAEETNLQRLTHDPAATYRPQGELVVYAPPHQPAALAWKFNIFAQRPLSRVYVYVDAATGQV